MQTGFNAKAQRCKDAKAETDFEFQKEVHFLMTSLKVSLASDFSSPLRLCFFALRTSTEWKRFGALPED